jgi:adenosine deaminase
MIDPQLPLIDLHRHLDGSLRLETILELGDQHGIKLPADDVEGLRPHVVVADNEPGLMAFIARFKWLTAVLADVAACHRIARECVEDAAREGLAYIELRFSPLFMSETHGLDVTEVTEAVVDGVAAGSRETGVPAGLIGILSRTYGPEAGHQELAALLGCRNSLVALDLAGDEARFPAELFVEHFRLARDAGLAVTVHAGEAAGPESVWSAIRDLGASRIGHALRAGEDPALLDYMAEHRIGIEANLTSNVQTSSVPGYADHPLASQLRHGLVATINTDDPAISGIDLRHEYEVAAPQAGLDQQLARQAQGNALELAFLSPSQKAELATRYRSASPPPGS